jgi:hypothetical protein
LDKPYLKGKNWSWWCVPVIQLGQNVRIGGLQFMLPWAKSKHYLLNNHSKKLLESWFKRRNTCLESLKLRSQPQHLHPVKVIVEYFRKRIQTIKDNIQDIVQVTLDTWNTTYLKLKLLLFAKDYKGIKRKMWILSINFHK